LSTPPQPIADLAISTPLRLCASPDIVDRMHGNAVVALLKLLVVAEHCFRDLRARISRHTHTHTLTGSVAPDVLYQQINIDCWTA